MLKNLSERFKRELLVFFNYAYRSGKMFKDWKENQTIFIEKKKINKFRPNTMSSCVGKILERMINKRLVWLCESRGVFDKNQNGFRKEKSCVDNLVKLVSEIEIGMKNNLNTMAVFLDVKSAYDNVKTV